MKILCIILIAEIIFDDTVLVDHNGQPYKRYSPKASPFKFKDDIEELLEKKEKSS